MSTTSMAQATLETRNANSISSRSRDQPDDLRMSIYVVNHRRDYLPVIEEGRA